MREERELQALLRGELLRSWTASVAEQLERFSDEDASEPFGDGFMETGWKIAEAIIVNAEQTHVKFSERKGGHRHCHIHGEKRRQEQVPGGA